MTVDQQKNLVIIDYDAGNIKSVETAVRLLKPEDMRILVTDDPEEILRADRVILPGVGAFGDAMSKLNTHGLDTAIRQVIDRQVPFLGICLGLQLLFESSEESPGVDGLSVLQGRIRRLPDGEGRKVPQIGWNRLEFPRSGRFFDDNLLQNAAAVTGEPYAYFVHSYYLEASDSSIVSATCEYGVTVHAAVEKGNLFACQFHPEKSGPFGLSLLHHFINHL
ncbi:MAG: imidazole glycerol phosphate synthase subunit HisH [Lachnospiraceae bacterium]|nr:imidazole glycerol phosphate synthase subunit HisH [Lachnospiraceae bacterium]